MGRRAHWIAGRLLGGETRGDGMERGSVSAIRKGVEAGFLFGQEGGGDAGEDAF